MNHYFLIPKSIKFYNFEAIFKKHSKASLIYIKKTGDKISCDKNSEVLPKKGPVKTDQEMEELMKHYRDSVMKLDPYYNRKENNK